MASTPSIKMMEVLLRDEKQRVEQIRHAVRGRKSVLIGLKPMNNAAAARKRYPLAFRQTPIATTTTRTLQCLSVFLFCWRKFRYLPDQFFRIIKPKYTFLDLAVYFSVVRLSKSALYIYIHICTYNF